jgi:hypothetical protein
MGKRSSPLTICDGIEMLEGSNEVHAAIKIRADICDVWKNRMAPVSQFGQICFGDSIGAHVYDRATDLSS